MSAIEKDEMLGTDSEILHEIDAEGRDAGVEVEDVESDAIVDPFDPKLIDVTTEVRTLDGLLKRMKAGQIDLDPDFQRSRGVWNTTKKSLLIESLLLRIPLPTFYVAEAAGDDDFADDTWAVVDGIQRLSTIAEFVEPALLGVQSDLRLTGMQYLKTEEGKRFDELSPALQLRVLESQFTMQVIRKSTPEKVKLNIFARINTGGVPLSAQELRHALVPGPARQVLRDLSGSNEFRNAVAHSVSPTRMADREMVLRFLAFRMQDPATYRNQDFDEFLRQSMRRINSWSEDERAAASSEFKQAMTVSRKVFADDAFRKRYRESDPRRPVSKALFEAMSVALATVLASFGEDAESVMVRHKTTIRRGFIGLMGDRDFDRSISQGTGDPNRVTYRFGRTLELIREATTT